MLLLDQQRLSGTENPVKIGGIGVGKGEAKPNAVILSEIAEEDDLSSISESNPLLGAARASLGKSVKDGHSGKISRVGGEPPQPKHKRSRASDGNIDAIPHAQLVRPLNHQAN